MKVIVAGMPKTGTKSMNAALTKLGYNVYDVMENMWSLCDDYDNIVFEGWTTEDFRRMYENIDAIVDFPAYYFWDEIHRAFPDAKIILTLRDDEDEWFRSYEKQIAANQSKFIFDLMRLLSPTFKRTIGFSKRLLMVSLGMDQRDFRKTKLNPSLSKKIYRAHNAYVQHAAPKDKLLVFKCKEGWGPLCEFLGAPVPDKPFPHANAGASIVNDIDKNPVFVKMRREALMNSAFIVAAAVASTTMIYKYGFSGIYESTSQFMNRIFSHIFST